MIRCIMLDLTAWGRQGCCHSVSPDPADNEAEKRLPAGTGHMQRCLAAQVTDRHPGHSPSTGSPTSPALLPCLAAELQSIPGSAGTTLQVDPAVGLLRLPRWGHLHVWAAKDAAPLQLLAAQIHRQAGTQGHTHRGKSPLLEVDFNELRGRLWWSRQGRDQTLGMC